MATTKDFEPLVSLDVPGCPLPVVRQALILSAQEFCRRSRAWKAECGAGTTSDGVLLYTIVQPAEGRVVTIEWLKAGGTEVSQAQYTSEATGVIRFLSAPPAGRALECRVSLEPVLSAATLPDVLLESAEGVAAGAKYRLMVQPGKPWSSPDLAAYHKQVFDGAIGNAFIQGAHGRQVSSLSVKPRSFGGY